MHPWASPQRLSLSKHFSECPVARSPCHKRPSQSRGRCSLFLQVNGTEARERRSSVTPDLSPAEREPFMRRRFPDRGGLPRQPWQRAFDTGALAFSKARLILLYQNREYKQSIPGQSNEAGEEEGTASELTHQSGRERCAGGDRESLRGPGTAGGGACLSAAGQSLWRQVPAAWGSQAGSFQLQQVLSGLTPFLTVRIDSRCRGAASPPGDTRAQGFLAFGQGASPVLACWVGQLYCACAEHGVT